MKGIVDMIVKTAVVYSLSPELAMWCCLINVPVSAIIFMSSFEYLGKMHGKRRRVEEVGGSQTGELLKEIVTVKIFATEDQEQKKFAVNSLCCSAIGMTMGAIQEMVWMIFMFVYAGGRVFNFYFCFNLREEGKMSGQEMIVCLMVLEQMQWTMTDMMFQVPNLFKLMDPVNRVAALLDSKPKYVYPLFLPCMLLFDCPTSITTLSPGSSRARMTTTTSSSLRDFVET